MMNLNQLITGLHKNNPNKNASFAEIVKTEVGIVKTKGGGGGGGGSWSWQWWIH